MPKNQWIGIWNAACANTDLGGAATMAEAPDRLTEQSTDKEFHAVSTVLRHWATQLTEDGGSDPERPEHGTENEVMHGLDLLEMRTMKSNFEPYKVCNERFPCCMCKHSGRPSYDQPCRSCGPVKGIES